MTEAAEGRIAAEASVLVARERVRATAGELRASLNPRRLATEGLEDLASRGRDFGQTVVSTTKRQPLLITAVIASLAVFAVGRRVRQAHVGKRATRPRRKS